MRIVTLKPAFSGPTAGYMAVEVERVEDEWGPDEFVDDELRQGPFSDALLVAHTKAIEWAQELRLPFRG